MAYVGRQPEIGNFRKCDAITTSATATYNLLVGGVAVNPNQNQCVVSLNGVVQSSGDSYTIASSQITFASALTSSDVIDFILILGDVLDVGVPSDDTVDASKITANVITGQSALGAAPADTDEFLVSDAGTLKRVDYSYIKGITQTSFLPTAAPLIINGDMQIAQRGTSTASITSNGYYTCDRWYHRNSSLGTWTQTQESLTSGDAYTDGFSKSLKMDNTTADASPSAGDFGRIDYRFEGQDLQLFKKGTANAEKYTVSFWIKATKTGTNICQLWDNDNNRAVSQAYTVSSTNTWEYKIVNFPADTTGVMGNDNAYSLAVQFWLGAGTDFTSGTLQETWAAQDNTTAAVGQVNNADSTSNNWEITGVQHEVGEYTSSDLPPFRHESYGDNLARCQRYYYNVNPTNEQYGSIAMAAYYSTSIIQSSTTFPVTMRATPTADFVTGTNYFNINVNSANDEFSVLTMEKPTLNTADYVADALVSATSGAAGRLRFNSTSGRLRFTAEL